MTTLRQIQANRRNAKLSTGPRSAEGREEASSHATKHGMSAATWFQEEEERLLEARLAALEAELEPEGEYQRLLVVEIAAASIRIERCRLEEETWRGRTALRAGCFWDVDREAEVAEQAERLTVKPALMAPRLRQSLHGTDWLLGSWRVLEARVAAPDESGRPQPLDEESRALAFDLLGLSASQRQLATPLDPPAGSTVDVAVHQAAFVARQIAKLEHKRVALAAADEFDRAAAELGQRPGVDPTLRLIRRYEADAQRLLRRAHDELARSKTLAQAREEEELDRLDRLDSPLRRRSDTGALPGVKERLAPRKVLSPEMRAEISRHRPLKALDLPVTPPAASPPANATAPAATTAPREETVLDVSAAPSLSPLPLAASIDPVTELINSRMIRVSPSLGKPCPQYTAHRAHKHRGRRARTAGAAERAPK